MRNFAKFVAFEKKKVWERNISAYLSCRQDLNRG